MTRYKIPSPLAGFLLAEVIGLGVDNGGIIVYNYCRLENKSVERKENLMSQISITIKNDDEGFYGSETHDEINHEASLQKYEAQITKAIKKVYPGAEVNHEYGPYAGKSIFVDSGDYATDGEISDYVAEIVGRVYNDGMFWVENK